MECKPFISTENTIKRPYRTVITQVWMPKRLTATNFFFKNQLYKKRSGDITCKLGPYCAITKYPKGTHHRTPYDYDLHVPLIIYQKDKFENKKINKQVWMTQFANTLAKIFEIAGPAASVFEPLPGI